MSSSCIAVARPTMGISRTPNADTVSAHAITVLTEQSKTFNLADAFEPLISRSD